jgi:hypothetical protein
VYVARDRSARLDPAAVSLLVEGLHQINLPLDKERAAALSTTPIGFELTDSGRTYTLDPAAERPRLAPAETLDGAPLVIAGPDEEVVRFVSGRHYVPGAATRLEAKRGSAQDLAGVRRAFR